MATSSASVCWGVAGAAAARAGGFAGASGGLVESDPQPEIVEQKTIEYMILYRISKAI